MPLQQIILTKEAIKLLGWLEKEGPCEMDENIFEASVVAQELKENCLADYGEGALCLIKDCKA